MIASVFKYRRCLQSKMKRILFYLLLLFNSQMVLANSSVVAEPVLAAEEKVVSEQSLEFKQPTEKAGKSLVKSLVILLVLAGLVVLGLVLKPKLLDKKLETSEGVQVVSRKTIGPNLVAIQIEVDGNKYLITQDKQGHRVTNLTVEASNKIQEEV